MPAELVCAATDRDAWLTARRSGVTATDIVTILGLNPWASEYALYWEKLGKLPPFEGNARTRLGQYLETFVAARWLEEQDKPNRETHPESWGCLYRSTERPWQLATLDLTFGSTSCLECKTWDDHDRAAWEGTIPPRVRAQVLWQMDTLGVGVGHVGVLFLPSGEFESRVIEHPNWVEPLAHEVPDDRCQVCADIAYMRQVGEAFGGRVREGLPPFPDGSPATLAAVKALHPDCSGEVEIPGEVYLSWLEGRDALAIAKALAAEHEAALRLELGGAAVGLVEGVPVVKRTRYEVAAKTIDRKAYSVDKLARLGARNGDGDE